MKETDYKKEMLKCFEDADEILREAHGSTDTFTFEKTEVAVALFIARYTK